ncbi:MAG TPA: hypothetical protein VF921_20405, partial [Vicinamibacterales bacterium]
RLQRHADAARAAGRAGADGVRQSLKRRLAIADWVSAGPPFAQNLRHYPDEARIDSMRQAQRESLTTVFTIDHDDFETYRFGGRRRLRILPSR